MIAHRQIAGAAGLLFIGAMFMANAQTPKLDPETFLPPPPAWSGVSEKLIAARKDRGLRHPKRPG
jgi:hypothetical protein